MLYTRDVHYKVTITDKETGEKVEDRAGFVARGTSLSSEEIKANAVKSAKRRAEKEYELTSYRITVSGMKEKLYDGSH